MDGIKPDTGVLDIGALTPDAIFPIPVRVRVTCGRPRLRCRRSSKSDKTKNEKRTPRGISNSAIGRLQNRIMVTPRSDGDGHGCSVGALVAAVRVGKRKSARSADVHEPCRGQQPRRGPAGRPVSTAVTRCGYCGNPSAVSRCRRDVAPEQLFRVFARYQNRYFRVTCKIRACAVRVLVGLRAGSCCSHCCCLLVPPGKTDGK